MGVRICPNCEGAGKVFVIDEGFTPENIKFYEQTCEVCKGKGFIEEGKELKVVCEKTYNGAGDTMYLLTDGEDYYIEDGAIYKISEEKAKEFIKLFGKGA